MVIGNIEGIILIYGSYLLNMVKGIEKNKFLSFGRMIFMRKYRKNSNNKNN